MTSYLLEEMFPACDGAGLWDAEVDSVSVNRSERSMTVELRPKAYIPAAQKKRLAESLKGMFGLGEVNISARYSPDMLSEDAVRGTVEELLEGRAAAQNLLRGSELEVKRGEVTFRLEHGGGDMLGSWADELRAALKDSFGCEAEVCFASKDNGSAEEAEKRRAETIQTLEKQAAEEMKNLAESAESPLIYGRRVGGEGYIPMNEMTVDSGRQTVHGKVIWTEHIEKTRMGSCVMKFDIADDTGAVRVSRAFRPAREDDGDGQNDRFRRDANAPTAEILKKIDTGMWLAVSGRMVYNEFDKCAVIDPDTIWRIDPPKGREDNAPEKRVELHLHTKMSAMDATVGAGDAVRRAAAWGHRAVAITDHGVVHAFPDAMMAQEKINKGREKGDEFKVLYGTECYFVNDIERVRSVYGDASAPLSGEFVAFDIETTGLSAASDRIIEIGAVRFRSGEIVDRFNTFAAPGRPLPQKIVELTGITDEMLRGAPGIETAIRGFLEFAGESVLAAHNATFDVGFISAACRELGIPFEPTFIDSRNMARGLLPTLTKFDLHTVSLETKVPEFRHHRASDDAAAVAYILFDFFARLTAAGVNDISGINGYLAENVGSNVLTGRSNHMILLAKNETGLRNLYDLISAGFLEHYKRNPLVPRTELDRRREGLLVGSACEAGELFRAMVDGAPESELLRIADYYDYLEIQPIGNNMFLLREGRVKDEEELRDFNRRIVELGEKLGKPVVATCDVHFMEPEDEIYRRVLMSGFADGEQQAPLFFRTTEEMLEEFMYLGEEKAREVVITNPNRIADMCELVRPVRHGTFEPKIENSAEDLRSLVESKLERLYGKDVHPLIRERVETEMKSIVGHGFDVIYMIAQKLVAKSLEDGYLVGSRGSVGSSIVAFLSDITEVNALPPHYRCPKCKHHEFSDAAPTGPDLPDKKCPVCGTDYEKDGFDILFATFLGFEGDKKPDIDLNFSSEYQSRAHQYTIELFGEGQVFRAGTIGTIAEKNAIGYVRKYAEEHELTLTRAEENRLAQGIVGVRKTTGQHPGGLIVVPRGHNICEFTPIQHPADKSESNIITTHFDYHSIEENLLKLDELGHDDPTIIRMLQDLSGMDPRLVPLDDKDTMSIFLSTEALGFTDDPILGGRGTVAVPEFGTSFVRGMLEDTNPKTFDELLRISGLSHGTNVWLDNAKDYIEQGLATLKEVVGARDDITIFLMSKGIANKQAFSMSEAIRKGKGVKAEWEAEMREHGVPEWYIESCKKIKYLFPKAHAAAYVLSAFRIAWYKVHRPLDFYCTYFTIRAKVLDANIMTSGLEGVKSKILELREAKNLTARDEDLLTTLEVVYEFYLRGLDMAKIDLYRSDATKFIEVGKKTLLLPFTALPGLGEQAAREIVEERKNGEFISVEDLEVRCPKVSKAVVELLQSCGALDSLPESNQVSLF